MARAGTSSGSGALLPVLLLGGAYIGYRALRRNVIVPKKLQQYTARLRVNMPAVRFKGDNVELDIYIQNPNSYPLTINAIVGDVYVSTNAGIYKLGNLDRYGDVVIQPLAETKYTLGIRTRFLGFLPYFTAIAAGKIRTQTVIFSGTVTVNRRPWPVKESLRIS